MRTLASTSALRYPALLFLAGFLAHDADHLRRGLAVLTPEVLWIGALSGVITLAAIGLTLLNYRFTPLLAVAVGFGMALGVAIVHLLPRWSAFRGRQPPYRHRSQSMRARRPAQTR